jgi:copper transport protein
MGPLSTAARRVALLGTLAVLFALLFATPAAAHAELVSITPANGAQLKTPPTQVQMTFTESVNLIDDGIRLVDDAGATVPTPDPTVDGHTVIWPMPADLPDGAYVVTWRVVSADGHPVSGASSFGVGTAAAAVSVQPPGLAVLIPPAALWRPGRARRGRWLLSVWSATSRSPCSPAWPRSCCFAHRTPAKIPICSA